MLRSALPQIQALAPSSWAWVLQLSAGAVAFFGVHHAVSGATTNVTSPGNANATVGHTYTTGAPIYSMTTGPQIAESWTVSPNPPAPGVTVSGFSWIGTPTTPGTYNVTITGWESPGQTGASTPPQTVVFNVAGVAPTAPSNLSATAVSSNQINLSWTDNSANETQFKIQQARTTNGPWTQISTVNSNVVTFSSTGLNPSTTYYYQVLASNSSGDSAPTSPAFATTVNVPPVLATIGSKTVTATSNLTFTATATDVGENSTNIITDFESFASGTANGTVMFRDPRFSTNTTTAFLDNSATYSSVTNTFPGTHTGTRVLVSRCGFTNTTTAPWLRLVTTAAANIPNPVVNLNGYLTFDVYSSANIKLALGLRETNSNVAYGGDGGTNGVIEWCGVSGTNVNSLGQATPAPTRAIASNSWQTVQFNIPAEPAVGFTGNGIIATSTGKGVLEHLAILPNGGTGNLTNYFDNFAIINTNQVFYNLSGAPSGASINRTNGVFTWTPSLIQTGLVTFAVIATDNGVPNLSATQMVTVTVSSITNTAPSLAVIPNQFAEAGRTLIVTNAASDADFPAQALTFSLGGGAPVGASINSSTGIFTW